MFIGLESPVCYSANDTPSDAIFTECTRTKMDACLTEIKHLFHFRGKIRNLMFVAQTKSCFASGKCFTRIKLV